MPAFPSAVELSDAGVPSSSTASVVVDVHVELLGRVERLVVAETAAMMMSRLHPVGLTGWFVVLLLEGIEEEAKTE